MNQWHIVYLGNPKRLNHLVEALRMVTKDCTVWIPTQKIFHRLKGKAFQVDKPLFPSYIFFNFQYKENIGINEVEEIVGTSSGGILLKAPGAVMPTTLTDEEVSRIKLLAEEKQNIETLAEEHGLHIDDMVEILTGQFLGMTGRISEIHREKVIVEVEMFNRKTQVAVDPIYCNKK